jgi:hypothetical protein
MKTIASVEDIRAEMQRRIKTSTWGKGYYADCSAPFPYRIPHDGIANWTANVSATAKPGCEGFLLETIATMRRDYDLPPQPLSDVVAHLMSWRKGSRQS